ncbi:CDGSH iron-sulfur domain-containing protein [Nocardia wallacei]|uniref:CDGSH iron-sulfur domain-containing protein n=1 Tax=Nocardia wallacei TaxID=480035 RepID=UPI0024554048|nr:CDGSH iron-sulfur domain-containing protein [Nocardia wallacei]
MPTEPHSESRRVTLTKDGPALIEGPVDLVTDDGATIHCDRFVVAVCMCRRSRTYPLCDTSHRRHKRATRD